jgi:hypothetical protein
VSAFGRFLRAPSTGALLDRMLVDNAATDAQVAASMHPLRSGTCVCGLAVFLHFNEDNAKVSCNEAEIRRFLLGESGEPQQGHQARTTDAHASGISAQHADRVGQFGAEGRR